MKFRLIKPEHDDFRFHCEQLKTAFANAVDPKTEFEEMRDAVQAQRASFYHLSGKGFSVRFVGQVRDKDYFVWALTGKGIIDATLKGIIPTVKACGYESITYGTYRKGMRRILSGLGFQSIQYQREAVATFHRLEV
ncbi:conserved hypothetical protein [Vibrio nigripulchritudo SFn27]|uniref:Acyl-CoA N-acyltransferase n=1 Tax=Vibrio nigripulchritudo TaxID=28173 RepID=U4K2I4_9VIBR|nr:hypothetical protein [Vibrio nigripulchritudo]CCN85478.1 conserved hypothetical protein [Vibrio nigripulchritudo BLFn1]CCN89053.1 conserved hypothetical protein [Vibrio nigripulchritudo SFn27]CCN95447.1 conserved hypothetical protein [Vibrio nigripulchritudo ENn2]CCO43204.1 conserved hypothetical protein [Vibrio nigripulchritudo SFn135]CCO54510.1 conserved hypothetical protein [Vibrio nigripulchritudo Wn13]